MRNKDFFIILVLAVLVASGLIPVVNAAPLQQATTLISTDAVVLVNSASANYLDFQHYVQPYLDNFGVPYTVLDIATAAVESNIGDYALIIVGHRQLDISDTHLDATEEGYISAAVTAGTGLVNFDNDLSVGGSTPRYQFVEDIFGFGYLPPSTGSGVTFTSESGGGLQINCWEDDHQDPVLETFYDVSGFVPDNNQWDEFKWVARPYPAVFASQIESPPVMKFYGTVPNGTYQVIANLYRSNDFRYYYGFDLSDPRAYSVDVTTGPIGNFAEFDLGTVTVTDNLFALYTDHADVITDRGAFPYYGWAWIRLVPVDAPPPEMHYITERHQAGETISTGAMTMAGITLPEGVTALAMTSSQPFLAVTTSGLGHAVQWGSYNWMSHSVKGPIYGLDDLVWRSIVWAARKPFVMQGLPPFVTMRVDDESGPFGWIEIANEFGFKPWAGLFYYNVDDTEAAQLSDLVNSGNATAAVHAKTGAFFYYNHNVGDFSDAEIAANYAHATAWHDDHDIPISKFVLPHYYEFGTNVFQGLSDWGVEFVGTMMDPGTGYGAPWIMNGPYRLYETGGSSGGRPVYYADFMTIPGHEEEFEGQFFNCVTEIRDDAGYEWYPSNDVPVSIGRGTRQTIRALDSMALATLFTHGQHVHPISSANWRAILDGITTNLEPYNPIYVTLDHACQYVRAMHTSDITASTYDPASRQVTTDLGGETDMPTMFYLFTEQGEDIHHVLVDVPTFSGSTVVAYTLAGPLDHIVVTPASATVALGGAQQFTAEGYDADENPIPNLPFAWSVVNGGGTIDSNGLFTAGFVAGSYADTVEASFGGVSGYAWVEVVAPALDHFTFEPIGSPQYVGAPFQVSIAARDISGNLLLGYSGPAALSDSTGTIDPVVTGSFSGGLWTGEVTIGQAAHDVTITASDGDATGTSEPFEVQEMPTFYQVTSPAYEHLAGESFLVTVTAYEGTTINLWEDDHQDPVLATTTDPAPLETTPGEWTEFHYVSGGRPFPSVMAEHDEYEEYGLPLMHFYASGIPNGEYEVIANLYESAPMRYFYGFTPGDPFAHHVDTPGGAPGTQHREYSLGTVSITDGTFNLYVQDADILGGTYPIFGWAWVRLVPVEAGLRINCWEDDHQDPVLVPFTNPALLNDHDGKWDEFDYANRDYPSVMAGHNEWETYGLEPMHFFADGIPDGPYEVWANLYTGRQTRHYYGFTEAEALAETRWVDNVVGAGGANQHAEYLLGVVEITDGRFDLWAGDGDSTSPYFYGWAWIRLVPAGITMSSSSPTMLFDADGDGTFGEPGDDVKPLVGGTFDIMARDTTAGTDVAIVATDVLGQFGYNTYTILSVNQPPVADAGGPYTYINEGDSVTLDASGSSDPDDNIVLYEWDLDNDGEYDDAPGVTTDVVFDDNGIFTVGLRVTDEFGESDTDTAEVTVDNVAPTVDAGADQTVNEGTTVALDPATFDDPGVADTHTATIDWGDGSLPEAGVVTESDGSGTVAGSHVYADNGTYTVEVCVTDDDLAETCDTLEVTVNNVAPVATVDIESQTVQYSDNICDVTFTATDVAADSMSGSTSWSFDSGDFTPGLPDDLTLTDNGCSVSDGTNTCTWTLSGIMDEMAGEYTVRVTVADDDSGQTETDITIIVEPEDASVRFHGGNPVAVQVAAAGGESGAFELRVDVRESYPDIGTAPQPGDISLADIVMQLVPVGPGGSEHPVSCSRAVTGVGYDAILRVTCSFDEVPVNTYTVQVSDDGGYYSSEGEDVLVVYDPSLGFTTGGGWFYWPETDEHTRFGFTMEYNKSGKNVRGSLLLIRHLEDDDMIYRVKSNALHGLALGDESDFGWASFSGKCTYLEPDWPEAVGNHEFLVYVEDHNESGTGVDGFWIEVRDKDGNVISVMSMDRTGEGNAIPIPIEEGNIVVPHGAGGGKKK